MNKEEHKRALIELFDDSPGKRDYFLDDEDREVIIEALEKRIPSKPKEYEDKYYGCPVCGNILMFKWMIYPEKLMPKSDGLPYCLGCGQAIDWSVLND